MDELKAIFGDMAAANNNFLQVPAKGQDAIYLSSGLLALSKAIAAMSAYIEGQSKGAVEKEVTANE